MFQNFETIKYGFIDYSNLYIENKNKRKDLIESVEQKSQSLNNSYIKENYKINNNYMDGKSNRLGNQIPPEMKLNSIDYYNNVIQDLKNQIKYNNNAQVR